MPHPKRTDLPAFYGVAMVACWLGVTRDAAGNWLRRYDDWPEPAGRVFGPERYSYFWREDQRDDWIRWAYGKDVTVMVPLPATEGGSDGS